MAREETNRRVRMQPLTHPDSYLLKVVAKPSPLRARSLTLALRLIWFILDYSGIILDLDRGFGMSGGRVFGSSGRDVGPGSGHFLSFPDFPVSLPPSQQRVVLSCQPGYTLSP